jgi:hypothetical protein
MFKLGFLNSLMQYLNVVGIKLKCTNSRIISLDIQSRIYQNGKPVVGGAHGSHGEHIFCRHNIDIFVLKCFGLLPMFASYMY